MTVSVFQTSYYDTDGNMLWSELMTFSRLHGRNEIIIEKGVTYRVGRIAVAAGVQIVNLQNMRDTKGAYRHGLLA